MTSAPAVITSGFKRRKLLPSILCVKHMRSICYYICQSVSIFFIRISKNGTQKMAYMTGNDVPSLTVVKLRCEVGSKEDYRD